MSRPCNICIQTMLRYRVKRVFYTDENGELICERIDQMVLSERERDPSRHRIDY